MPENNELREINIKDCSYDIKVLINGIIHKNTKVCQKSCLGAPDYHIGYKASYGAEKTFNT